MFSNSGIPQIILTVFLNVQLLYYQVQTKCATEHFSININGTNRSFAWESKSDHFTEVIFSKPICFDENQQLVYKICSNGEWIDSERKCYFIEENKLCPPNFKETDGQCVYITPPQIWELGCPVYGSFATPKFNYDGTWLPVRRNVRYDFFEYILPDKHYGSKYSAPGLTSSNELSCLVSFNNSGLPIKCDEKHPHVCAYKYNRFLNRCPKNCTSGGLGSDYCFCKVYKKQSDSLWCKTLASPKYSYERFILHELVNDDTCLIQNFQNNLPIMDYISQNSMLIGINDEAFRLLGEDQVKCAICQVDPIQFEPSSLVLKFKVESCDLYLLVYSPESLLSNDDEIVYCFTVEDGNIRTRVDTEEVFDSKRDPKSGLTLQVFKVAINEENPSSYWCEAFQLPTLQNIQSNKVVSYKKFHGHEYSMRLKIFKICRFSSVECKNPSTAFVQDICKELFNDKFFHKFIKSVRLFYTYSIDVSNETVDVLVHITTDTNVPIMGEYFAIGKNLFRFALRNALVVFFRSSEVCLPEHTISGNTVLRWKMTPIGTITIPEELCIQENSIPVRRHCSGDFTFGAVWEKVKGTCSENVIMSFKTETLHSLKISNSMEYLTQNMSTLTKNCTDLTVIDLYYVAEIFAKMRKLNQINSLAHLKDVSEIIDNLMTSTNGTVMQQSQIHLNVTDEMLDTIDNILSSFNATDNLLLLKRDNLVIQITKPFVNNISGMMLHGNSSTSFNDSQIENLYTNTTLDYFLNDTELEVAAYVPSELLEDISQNLSITAKHDVIIITTIFYNDKFFNTVDNESHLIDSRVVSISIPGYGEFLKKPVVVIFKSNETGRQSNCAYWNYGINSQNFSGYWSKLGGFYIDELTDVSAEGCFYSHLTNFALLVRTDPIYANEDETFTYDLKVEVHDHVLTIISDIGCCLSIIGIVGIFVTSAVFQSWREKVGTRILIQLCITILLQIIIINFAQVKNLSKITENYCTAIGIILHYILIAEFSWMLVAAILQFYRFVQVIGRMPNRLFLKAMLIGWGLPILPILIVCSVNYDSYTAGLQGFCYPKGYSLYYGVLLPIAIIVSANLAVFIMVLRNVFLLHTESKNNSHKILTRQLCLAVLLFFLLGLPWIFGLLSELIDHDSTFSYLFVYLFCFTATLQGFVLFLFYVILDKSTRSLWYLLIKKTINENFG